MQNNPAVISERNIPKLNIIGCRFYVGAILVDIVYILQCFQLIHSRVHNSKHMGRVIDILHAAEHHKREQDKHQEERHTHLSLQCLPCTNKDNSHRSQFQGKQMQTVKGSKAFFYLDMNIFQVFTGITKVLDRGSFLSKRLYNGKPPDVFNRCAGHILHCFMGCCSGFFTVSADPLQSQRRKSNADNGNNRSNGAEEEQA